MVHPFNVPFNSDWKLILALIELTSTPHLKMY